mmetsp:Transcript_52371/g.145121  ORF Transcript_52371/g.145121 Transcript_52371/m.145121 type:complete len:266 (-) Transcript_52371:1448-2245(-)
MGACSQEHKYGFVQVHAKAEPALHVLQDLGRRRHDPCPGPTLNALRGIKLADGDRLPVAPHGRVATGSAVAVAAHVHECRVALRNLTNKVRICRSRRPHDPTGVVPKGIPETLQELCDTNTLAAPRLGHHKIPLESAAMATVIHLEAISVVKHVIVDPIETRTIVIIHALCSTIVRPYEVVSDFVHCGLKRCVAQAMGNVRKERLSVPRIDRAMISALTASVEDQVVFNNVTTTKAIIEVDCCPWQVEHNIVAECGTRRLGLEPP